MSVLIQGDQVRSITQGILVHRPAALPVDDGALFTVSGGRVLLLGFVGHVTVAIKNESLDIGIVFDPTVGSAVDLAESSTGVAIDADPAGTMYTLPAATSSGVTVGTSYAEGAILAAPRVLPAGVISLAIVGTVTGTADRIEWDLLYVPLDTGASVVAA